MESVYVLDGQASSKTRELWPGGTGGKTYKHMEVVGACNDVLCLCDDTKPGGVITLANPATGDALSLPLIPCTGLFRRHNTRRPSIWHQAYSFGYHHATGQYKVVHVPCFFKTKEMIHVFTLGEASWREVPALAPGADSMPIFGLSSSLDLSAARYLMPFVPLYRGKKKIFVRLPSLPSLVRAAFACRAFLHAVRSFPTFRPRFRDLHPPPLLGLFVRHCVGDIPSFVPLRGLADPDQSAVVRGSDFFLTRVPDDQGFWNVTNLRDGYLLLHNWEHRLFAAYSPLAGVLHRIPAPPEAVRELYILSPPEERHGSFRLVCVQEDGLQVRAVVFSSDTGEWQVLPWAEAAAINKNHPEDDKHCLPPRTGKLVDGRIYWTRHDYVIVLDTATLQFSSMDLPPYMYGQKPFVVGETKDDKLCMVCAIDEEDTIAVWVWRADADRVEKWMLDKEVEVEDLSTLKLVAVKQGFVHLHWMAVEEPGIVPLCDFFSLCLEKEEMKKIFSLYEYELEWSYPYIMPWPSSLVCNKVNPQI
ncbi:hypothetical protein ACQ4PT_064892 [Festuca glaucescens]